MQRIASFQELEVLGEGFAYDYMKKHGRLRSASLDIEGFITEYLGLKVVFENIAEEDATKIGFVSDGVTPLTVSRDNETSAVVFPKNTIVIDRYLLRNSQSSRRRFILAHEAAHVILEKHLPQRCEARYKSEFSQEAFYSFEDQMRMFSMDEVMTDRLAAVMLMPPFLVSRVIKRHNGGNAVCCFEGCVFSPKARLTVQKMADDLGVSYSAMINRLRELKLLEIRPVGEYIAELKKAVQ